MPREAPIVLVLSVLVLILFLFIQFRHEVLSDRFILCFRTTVCITGAVFVVQLSDCIAQVIWINTGFVAANIVAIPVPVLLAQIARLGAFGPI